MISPTSRPEFATSPNLTNPHAHIDSSSCKARRKKAKTNRKHHQYEYSIQLYTKNNPVPKNVIVTPH